MKRLFLGVGALFILLLGGRVMADPATDTSVVAKSPDYELTEKINGIDVPYSVLLDAQMDYQGYAVVTAYPAYRGGQNVYRLHIQSSSAGNMTRENIYLLYDLNWHFLGDEKTWAPLHENSKPEPKKKDKPENSAPAEDEPGEIEPPEETEEPEEPDTEEPIEPVEPARPRRPGTR